MAALEPEREAFLLATETQFGDIDDRRGVMRCEVIQSEEGALGIDARAIHIDIGKGWGFHRARSQSPDLSNQSRQQTHEALLAFGCQIPLDASLRRRAESMPPVGLFRSKSEQLAGMPLFGAGADIALAGGKKLEGLPEYPRGDQLSARETRQRLCDISIDHQPRRRSPPAESLLQTRAWETLSPRQQNEHTLEAEKYASLLGRDTLRHQSVEDVAPRMLKDNLSSNSTASSVTMRSPRRHWNKYFHLQTSSLNTADQSPRIENDIARWYKANYSKPALRTTPCLMTKPRGAKHAWAADRETVQRPLEEESDRADVATAAQSTTYSLETSPVRCRVAAYWKPLEAESHPAEVAIATQSVTHSLETSPASYHMAPHCFVKPPPADSSPTKDDGESGDITPAATTAGCSTAGSSPPSSTPPVPMSPPVPDSELIVTGKITIPARLHAGVRTYAGHDMKSSRKCPMPMVVSPSKQQPRVQNVKLNGRPQLRDKCRGPVGRSGAMSTPVPGMYKPTLSIPARSTAPGNTSRKNSGSDNQAAIARVKALKAQLNSSSFDLASVQMELDAVEKILQ